MKWMEKQQIERVHVSRKRMIFEMWRHTLQREKAFAFAVKNVMEKSLFKEGFDQICYYNRDEAYTNIVHRVLKKFSLRSARINQSDSFNKWKMFGLSKVDSHKNEVEAEFRQKSAEFEAFVDKVKETNNARCFKYF